MSVEIMSKVWHIDVGDPTRKLILLCLADAANFADYTCWPAIDRIARRCEVSRRTVQYHLRALEQFGLIRTRRRDEDGTTNLYYVLDDIPPEFQKEGGAKSAPVQPTARGVCNPLHEGGATDCTQTIIEPSENQNIKLENGFEEFWEAYGLKVGKTKCRSIWKRKKLAHKADTIVSGAKAYVKALGKDRQYQKHPSTWLNGEHWEDEVVTQPGSVTETKLSEDKLQDFIEHGSEEWEAVKKARARENKSLLPMNTTEGYGRWVLASEVEAALKLKEKLDA